MDLERSLVVTNATKRVNDPLKIVITDGTTDIARSFAYKVLYGHVFGKDRPIVMSFYELPDKATFLESVMIELTSFAPNLLHDISYGHEAAVEFNNADVVVCIGFAREYDFKPDEYDDPFFQEHIRISKFYGEAIERYVKRDARIIVLGNTAATIISRYATSIPKRNITTPSLINSNIATSQIAARMQCLPTDVKGVIIWGSNGSCSFPDCRYMYLATGKPVTDSLRVWIRNNLAKVIRNVSSRPAHIRSIAYALAEHCRTLWHGTLENEWTNMGVFSDHSYSVRSGIFFSFPVHCRNKQCEIVQDLDCDRYIKKYIWDLSRLINREIQYGFDICGIPCSY
ncbi:malate dehydrogenase, cytoplasmic [Ceratina calcarata]|uniref:Malate dehydrogenase, cytoplasmic n=1 Tax=Ceratina calcarata TaxID=156304 RepID=A0AAJ7JDV0_9HYME|nr:malate dehydrogenase, cytoplasmic [Ceratina calcarata]